MYAKALMEKNQDQDYVQLQEWNLICNRSLK